MDPFSNLSQANLTAAIWLSVAAFALVLGLWRRKQLQWVALSTVMLFAALNAGAGIYVLNTIGDSRWATDSSAPLQAPQLTQTPLVGQYLDTLDTALQSMVGGVNSFLAFQQALPVALTFLSRSGWALLIAVPLTILVAVLSYQAVLRQRRELARYRDTVDQLKTDLAQMQGRFEELAVLVTGNDSLQALGQTRRDEQR